MADYRLSAQIIGRGTGRSAVAAAAYRAGASLADERTGLVHDFSRRGGVLHSEIIAPDDAPAWMTDRAQLWNAVERAEKRGDAQLAREVQLSLPHELDDAQRLALVRSFIRDQYTARGVIADFAIHAPGKGGDDRNHHAHIMLTMRELTGEGFGKKFRATMTERQAELVKEREAWADLQNLTLEKAGFLARVDHRSFEARGIDREAQQHTGPAVQQMEKRGERTRVGDENRRREEDNSMRAIRHGSAAVISFAIEKEKRALSDMAARRLGVLEDSQRLSDIDFSRRLDRERTAELESIARQYGAHRKTVLEELAAIDARSTAPAWKKAMRSLFGRGPRVDQERAALLRLTLANISGREREAVSTLTNRQAAERDRERLAQTKQRDELKNRLEIENTRRLKTMARREAWERDARQTRIERERQRRYALDEKKAAQQKPAQPFRAARVRSPEQTARLQERQTRIAVARSAREKIAAGSSALNISPVPAQERQPVKQDFDKSRLPTQPEPITARFVPVKAVSYSVPSPAPVPAGAVPRPVKAPQEVPKVDRAAEWAKSPEGQKALAEQARQQSPEKGRGPQEFRAKAPPPKIEKPAPAPQKPQEQRSPAAEQNREAPRLRDWWQEPTKTTPAPAAEPQKEAPKLRDWWSQEATRSAPARDVSPKKDRDDGPDFER